MAAQPPPRLAFWIHQVVEYLLGVLLISQAIQIEQPLVPALLGVGVILLAATADGPLAAFHVVPRPVHRVLDVVAVGVIVVVAVLYRDELGAIGLVFAGIAAAGLVGLVVRTNYAPKRPRQRRAEPSVAPVDERSPTPTSTPTPTPDPPSDPRSGHRRTGIPVEG